MQNNPFINIPYYPDFDKMTPELADAAFDTLIPQVSTQIDASEASLQPTWQCLVKDRDAITDPLFTAWGFMCHLKSVVDNPGWRTVEEKYLPKIIELSQRCSQSKPFYDACKTLQASGTLTPVQSRVLTNIITGMEHSGIGLPEDQQAVFNEKEQQASLLSMEFSNHLLDATKGYSITLTKPSEVAGIPETLRAAAAAAAGGTPYAGPWMISLDYASYGPFLTHCSNRAAREALFRAHATRASSGAISNVEIIENKLKLSTELAQMLGFPNYAALNLSTKMAQSVENVDTLMHQLADASIERSVEEVATRNAFARANGFNCEMLPWDRAYWSERQREKLFAYKSEELQRYFQFPKVLQGLFTLAQRIFGIQISEATGEVPVWHPDVRFFKVADADGTPLASFYLDPYSRPATKSGGAWMNEFRSRKRRADGSIQLPVAVLVCNQSVPTEGKPSLMLFGEVETLFHEFGHALQHMLTTVEEEGASGVNGIEWDAVEIASQFMENWCYDRATLKSITCHIDTGAELPDDLYEKIVASKNYMAACAMTRQLLFAMTDLDLYARYPRNDWKCAKDVYLANQKLLKIPENIPEDEFLCGFSHIFAGGYSAGYYSYKWSEVISADCFAAFEEAGLDNEAAIAETGRRFRATFLSLGGGTAPSEVFQKFRGRAPSIAAILRHSGLC